MRALLRFLCVVVTLVVLAARAQDAGPPQKDYVPKGGTGRVVVVITYWPPLSLWLPMLLKH